MKKNNLLKIKIRLKIYARIYFVYFIVFLITLGFSLILGKFLETILYLVSYCVFRKAFTKELHMDTTFKCLHLTFIMFFVSIVFILPKSSSLLFPLMFGLVCNIFLYLIKEVIDLKEIKNAKIVRGMNRKVLLEKCKKANFSEEEQNLLIYFYIDKMTIESIAEKYNYSIEWVKKTKRKLLRTIS